MTLRFRHVDVFAEHPYSGNGLIVVFGGTDRSAETLLRVAQELRQFETIFVTGGDDHRPAAARILTQEEELPFAGHPIIGAAAALHERLGNEQDMRSWTFVVAGRAITVHSRRRGDYYAASMNQGRPSWVTTLSDRDRLAFTRALNLEQSQLRPLPLQVVSTGLPYLIVPVTADGLARARIVAEDFSALLTHVSASFVYVFDPERLEGRTWDNAGSVEDVATGSAAGPAAAYLHGLGLADSSSPLELRQGSFVGRPSTIAVTRDADGAMWVGGPVAAVAEGTLDLPS